MTKHAVRTWNTPREQDLGLRRLANRAGLSISVLPNGSVFAIEHRTASATILVNQLLASPIEGGIARVALRMDGAEPLIVQAVGSRARISLGVAEDRIVWKGETNGMRHRVTLRLQPEDAAWLWQVEVFNARHGAVPLDAILVQDIGLGVLGFVTNNEAYASQYIDHHIAQHPRFGPAVMCRQNLAQDGKHPWVVHGCLDGAYGFATDAMQLFGPGYRDGEAIGFRFGDDLPNQRLQHEVACTALQSLPTTLEPGASVTWRFFAIYDPDHSGPSSHTDLTRIDAIEWCDLNSADVALTAPVRSLVQDAPSAIAAPLSEAALAQRYPERLHEECADGQMLSFFIPDPPHNRHVVLRDKERMVTRRHGTLLRTGHAMLPDESTLCATCWMHGAFGAQLTIGNTSFHKLFSVSRDPYNITRASGLRMLIDAGDGWRLLTVPSAFEMGLSDCRWIYGLDEHVVTVRAIASGDDPAMQWRITVEGEPCRFLVFGHVVLGERELEHEGVIEVDTRTTRFTFRPDPNSLWGQRYPHAVYHLVTSTREVVETIGGGELLYADGTPCSRAYVAIRTLPTHELCFAVVGALTHAETAARLAAKYENRIDDLVLLTPAADYWTRVTRGLRIVGGSSEATALDTVFPWLAHNAMIHLTVPHGLEQYTGAAWGTRDVCQGPVEFFLALEHDEPVKAILRIVFAQQYETRGDWPQWFMLEPYSNIQDRASHGDVIVWPLKALNDYLEATNDLAFLDEPIPWRREDTPDRTERADAVARHVDKLLETVGERFIPGTHLIRYGEGDWNDSLQPADSKLRDWMVSSWTVALLYQQISRYAEVMRRAGRDDEVGKLSSLATGMYRDFNRFLIRDNAVAGYALFEPGSEQPELLLHPSDTRTGLQYSLLPMTRSIIAGLFTPKQARRHLRLIREHLLFPDGVRLIDRPVTYRGGPERIFRRAESSSCFGREIGLMYVHAHLRYGEAMAVLGEAEALWEALQVANPIAVTECLAHASPRQRNAYFSSSDATFHDRYEASAEWARVKAGTIPVDGGWRIYSSGPGLYASLVICHAFGIRRHWGERVVQRVLPDTERDLTLAGLSKRVLIPASTARS
jgi:cellobiose phosphorylase